MMNKTIRELEKERLNHIKDLDIKDIKSYIVNLHKNRFESFENHNKAKANFYGDKIKEIFDITEGIYFNLDTYSDNCEIDLLYSKLIINNNNEVISRVLYQSQLLLNSEIQLNKDFKIYKSLMKNNDNALDDIIDLLKKSMIFIIFVMQVNLDYDREENISILQSNIKEDKKHCIDLFNTGDLRHKMMVDYGYIQTLNNLSEALNTYDRQCKSFIAIQNEILNLLYDVDDIEEIDFEDIFLKFEYEA